MNELIRPNFFIIGAPKSGTTALSEYLRGHPSVFFSDPKEPEYFASDFRGRVITKEKDYLRLFEAADPSRHRAVGEGSVVYIFSGVAVSNILQFQPDAKLILMLRNPADLVVSLHAQLVMEGNENMPSFLDAWNAEPDRRQGKRIPPGCRDVQWLYYSDWGKLGTQLNRVMNTVPALQLKVILFDDFALDTLANYRAVLAFLGLPDDGRTAFPKVNERRSPRSLLLQSLIGTGMRFWLPFRTRLTLGKGFGFGDFLMRLNAKDTARSQSAEVARMLTAYYAEEVALVEDLLHRDLRHWRATKVAA